MTYGQAALANASVSGSLGAPILPGHAGVAQPTSAPYTASVPSRSVGATAGTLRVSRLYTADDYRREIVRVKRARRRWVMIAAAILLVAVVAFIVMFVLGFPFKL